MDAVADVPEAVESEANVHDEGVGRCRRPRRRCRSVHRTGINVGIRLTRQECALAVNMTARPVNDI
jgi:hypothetical protein